MEKQTYEFLLAYFKENKVKPVGEMSLTEINDLQSDIARTIMSATLRQISEAQLEAYLSMKKESAAVEDAVRESAETVNDGCSVKTTPQERAAYARKCKAEKRMADEKRRRRLEIIEHARKCKAEKRARKMEAAKASEQTDEVKHTEQSIMESTVGQSAGNTTAKRRRRKYKFPMLQLRKRFPKDKTNVYCVYDRKDGRRVNALYAVVPEGTDNKNAQAMVKMSYSRKTGVHYFNIGCRKAGSERKASLSKNVKRY